MIKNLPKALEGAKRTLKMTIQYEGTHYVGWQRQAKGESIQGVLEKAIGKVASQKITLYGSGRTDAGVHAMGQVASFSLKALTPKKEAFKEGVNSLLPSDIRVLSVEEVDLKFLANRDAKRKSYHYFIENGPTPTVFLKPYCWYVRWPLDFDLMDQAAK